MPSLPASAAAVLPTDLLTGRRAGLWLVAALAAVAALLWTWWPAGVALGVTVGVLAVLAIGRRMEQEAAGEPIDEELGAALGVVPARADSDLTRAARLVVQAQYASAARLQRELQLPYSRARRLIDDLEREHVVGPATGTLPRRVLVPRERLTEVEQRLAR